MKKRWFFPIILLLSILLIFIIFFFGFHINLKGDKNIILMLNNEYQEIGYDFKLFGLKLNKKITVINNIDITKVGHYEVNYKTKFIFNYANKRNVFVKEEEPPIIILNGTSNICPLSKYNEEGYSATDNYDGDLTDKVEVIEEDDKFIYKVKDSSNNETIVTRYITYNDIEPPIINLLGGNIRIKIGEDYNELGYNAIDNCLGDITDKVEVLGNVNNKKEGNYIIDYKVSDGINETIEKRYVTVIDPLSIGIIYLTFDDGPDHNTTPKFLDILKKYNIKATFFIVPKGDTTDYLIEREYNEGHSIGIHSSSHVYSRIYSSDDALYDDINIVNEKIKNITGNYSYLYRYPGGGSNTVSKNYSKGIISRTSISLNNMGYHYFDWNISSGDAAGVTPPADTIYQNVISGLSKNRPNVVLMHDTKLNSANALENIIKYGLENGYTFEPITMNTKEVHHRISN